MRHAQRMVLLQNSINYFGKIVVVWFVTLSTDGEDIVNWGIRKEGRVLFNDALNTFSYGYRASDIW